MESSKIKGISPELLRRYVEMRHKIDAEADIVHSITSLLALLQNCGDDGMKVDQIALGKINQMLSIHILNIWEILDNFIYIIHAESELERLDNKK